MMISTLAPGCAVPVIRTGSPTLVWIGEATQVGRNGVAVGDAVAVAAWAARTEPAALSSWTRTTYSPG
jgi:hypothetical protein